jgi:O-antigen ligase
MSEFVNWGSLGTYGGALAMVMLLTQFTKDLPFTRRIPTQIWSYILAFIVLTASHVFTSGINPAAVGETLFNAVVVSLAANGGQSVLTRAGKVKGGEAAATVVYSGYIAPQEEDNGDA